MEKKNHTKTYGLSNIMAVEYGLIELETTPTGPDDGTGEVQLTLSADHFDSEEDENGKIALSLGEDEILNLIDMLNDSLKHLKRFRKKAVTV